MWLKEVLLTLFNTPAQSWLRKKKQRESEISIYRKRTACIYTSYYMAESVFAMRLVNLRSVTCYTDQNFIENAHFGALNLLPRKKG